MISARKVLCSLLFFLFISVRTNFAVDDIGMNGAQIKGHKKRLQEIQEELKRKKTGEAAVRKKEESIIEALGRIDKKLLARRGELNRLDSKYGRIQENIISVEKKLDRIQHKIDQNQTRLHSRIVALYKIWRVGYFPYLLSYESYNGFMRTVKFLKIVIDYDANLLRQYQDQWFSKKQYQDKLAKEIKDLKRTRAEQEKKKLEILRAKREKQTFLHAVKRQKAYYRRWIRELEDQARELQLLVKKLEKEGRDKGVSDLNFKNQKGRLSLPVRGDIILEKHRRGIVIKADQDSPIKAVYSGKVIYSGWFEGYGNIIIIDHGDKYYTVSAHASKLLRKNHDRVTKGEVIGFVGDTGSLRGPCLYFEIRYQGKLQDPLEWFSTPQKSNDLSQTKKGRATAGGRGKS
ncbi:MAG: murein hydrolase activator EnvC family protein [Thermodesulfobacteriota bacterium]